MGGSEKCSQVELSSSIMKNIKRNAKILNDDDRVFIKSIRCPRKTAIHENTVEATHLTKEIDNALTSSEGNVRKNSETSVHHLGKAENFKSTDKPSTKPEAKEKLSNRATNSAAEVPAETTSSKIVKSELVATEVNAIRSLGNTSKSRSKNIFDTPRRITRASAAKSVFEKAIEINQNDKPADSGKIRTDISLVEKPVFVRVMDLIVSESSDKLSVEKVETVDDDVEKKMKLEQDKRILRKRESVNYSDRFLSASDAKRKTPNAVVEEKLRKLSPKAVIEGLHNSESWMDNGSQNPDLLNSAEKAGESKPVERRYAMRARK